MAIAQETGGVGEKDDRFGSERNGELERQFIAVDIDGHDLLRARELAGSELGDSRSRGESEEGECRPR